MCGARRCARLLLQLVQLPQVLKHAGARSPPEPGPARPGLRGSPLLNHKPNHEHFVGQPSA